jgi:hypothetical protein
VATRILFLADSGSRRAGTQHDRVVPQVRDEVARRIPQLARTIVE